MRKMMMIFIAAFVIIAVGLIILMAAAIASRNTGASSRGFNMSLVNEQKVSLDGIDSISINYSSEDVTFYQSDSNELILKEYMNYTPDTDELTHIRQSDSELSLRGGRDYHNIFSFWFFNRNCSIEIYLPSGYSGKLSAETSSGTLYSGLVLKLAEFSANSSSGDIHFNEVSADTITARASSGNITFRSAEGTREFETTSGDIRILGGAGDSDLTASSGNITVEEASGRIEAEASSGDIRILDSAGGGRLETSSGNITLGLTSLTEDLNLNASSGNVSVALPDTASFNFSANASSGDIRTFFDDRLSYNERKNEASGTVGDNPEWNVDIETTSGNIRVND